MSPFSAIPAVWQTVIPLVLFCEAVLELGLLLYQLLHSRMPLRSLPCAVHLGILVTLLLSVTQGDPNAGKDAFLIHAAWLFFVIVIVLAALHFAIAFPREYRRRKNELSPFSIKEATDKLPMGICFADPDGRMILCNNRMRQLLLQYTVVGGMPDAVQTFVTSRQMDEVLRIQRDIVRSYEDDMVKYAEKKDKSRIKECFQSIPRQLAKENKKFQYSVVKKGSTSAKYAGSLQWIEDAGIITRCHNLSITELPLDGNAEEDTFKVYMCDTGLFVSMLEDGTQFDILQGDLYGYKGAIFENLIADIFTKMGRKLYYFHKDSGLEVDFVIRYQGECTLVEVKARSGNVKSTKTILNHPEKYHVSHAIKLGDYNIGKNGPLLTLPLYMAFLLRSC